jgi:DNA-binding transcriptional regulator YdaS (Cro superfamily)
MTPAVLEARSIALFGEQWQTAFARKAGVSPRTVRHWSAGDRPIPDWVDAILQAWEALALVEALDSMG